MKNIIRLNESELINLIKNIITESESDVKEINSPSVTSHIKNRLSVKDLSSGNYVYRETTSREHGGKTLLIKHPDIEKIKHPDEKKKKQTDIINMIQNKQGIPSGAGKWSIHGTYITFKK